MQRDAKNSASAQSGRSNRRSQNRLLGGQRKRLRKSTILRGYDAFSRVLSDGRTLSIPPIRLFIRLVRGQPPNISVGFAVSRTLRSASRRNRAKRLMREAYRLNQDLWSARDRTNGIEAVWMYSGDASARPDFSAVEASVRELMKKATSQKA